MLLYHPRSEAVDPEPSLAGVSSSAERPERQERVPVPLQVSELPLVQAELLEPELFLVPAPVGLLEPEL